jgi:bla regulator protein BlaR1
MLQAVKCLSVCAIGLLSLTRLCRASEQVGAQTATSNQTRDMADAATRPGTPGIPSKMSFDVASIRQSKPGPSAPMPNFALDDGDSYAPFPDPGGRFTADFPLWIYIQFAYKLSLTPEQTGSMLAHLPKWVDADYFEIHAKAEGNPTKSQMRLMMQSLLADRFRLAVHFETQVVPVFALVLEKPGRIGPKLRSHSDGPPCDVHMPPPAPGSSANMDGVFPRVCDAFLKIPVANHEMLLGSRNTTMKLIADSLPSIENLGRPVVDQTGLSGRFDFTLQWTPASDGPGQSGADASPDLPGTTFLEALKDQLGMKLKSTKAPIDVLFVDHVERPAEN